VTTDSNGAATIAWTGSRPGQDTLTAYVDSDGNGAFDPGFETRQAATYSWTGEAPAPPPVAPPPSATPPPAATSPPPPAAAPDNRFAILATTANRAGVIKLVLRSATAGAYSATARVSRSSRRALAYGRGQARATPNGRVTLAIQPSRAARARLKTTRTRVAIAITFTPRGGAARTKHRSVVVKAARR
jgi:hypothetical protein